MGRSMGVRKIPFVPNLKPPILTTSKNTTSNVDKNRPINITININIK